MVISRRECVREATVWRQTNNKWPAIALCFVLDGRVCDICTALLRAEKIVMSFGGRKVVEKWWKMVEKCKQKWKKNGGNKWGWSLFWETVCVCLA